MKIPDSTDQRLDLHDKEELKDHENRIQGFEGMREESTNLENQLIRIEANQKTIQ